MAERYWTAAEWDRIQHLAYMHRLGRASAQQGGPNRHQRHANAYARELRAYADMAIARGVAEPFGGRAAWPEGAAFVDAEGRFYDEQAQPLGVDVPRAADPLEGAPEVCEGCGAIEARNESHHHACPRGVKGGQGG